MERNRDGLVPIAEALADLPGPVQAIRKTPPPARRGFTQRRSSESACYGASEADPDHGLHGPDDGVVLPAPHQSRQPASSTSVSMDPYRLYMTSRTGELSFPIGNLPRLILAWLSYRSGTDPKP